jgi:chromosome segregation ATPase
MKLDQQTDFKEVLLAAEQEITTLRGRTIDLTKRAEQYQHTIDDLIQGETALEAQIMLLHSRAQELEQVIETSDDHIGEAADIVSAIRGQIDKLYETSSNVLEQAKEASSRLKVMVNLDEFNSLMDMSKDIELLDEYEKRIKSLQTKSNYNE